MEDTNLNPEVCPESYAIAERLTEPEVRIDASPCSWFVVYAFPTPALADEAYRRACDVVATKRIRGVSIFQAQRSTGPSVILTSLEAPSIRERALLQLCCANGGKPSRVSFYEVQAILEPPRSALD